MSMPRPKHAVIRKAGSSATTPRGNSNGRPGRTGDRRATEGTPSPEPEPLDPAFLAMISAAVEGLPDPISELVTAPGVKGKNATPLHFAAWNGDLDLVTFLVEHCNADIDTLDHDGFTPVCRAIYQGHSSVVHFLLRHGADLTIHTDLMHHALHFAVYKNDVELLEAVLSRKRTLNIDCQDRDGMTPLHWSALRGYPAMARVLITAGAEVDSTDIIGCTPLHLACSFGAAEVTRLLVNEGEADRNFPDREGNSPLHLAAKGGHVPCMVALSAILDTRNRQEESPLTVAVINGHTRAVRWLLNQGAEVNTFDARHRLPIHHGVEGGSVSIVSTLLEFGADIEAKDNKGNVPFDLTTDQAIIELKDKPRNLAHITALLTAKNRAVATSTPILAHIHASAPRALPG